jgi:hypothetical protein
MAALGMSTPKQGRRFNELAGGCAYPGRYRHGLLPRPILLGLILRLHAGREQERQPPRSLDRRIVGLDRAAVLAGDLRRQLVAV